MLLVLRWPLLLDLARHSGLWEVDTLMPVRTSALSPVAVALRRRDADHERRAVLTQLTKFSSYFEGPAAAVSTLAEVGAQNPVVAGVLDEVVDGRDTGAGSAPPKPMPSPRAVGSTLTDCDDRSSKGSETKEGAPRVSFIESRFTSKSEYEAWVTKEEAKQRSMSSAGRRRGKS